MEIPRLRHPIQILVRNFHRYHQELQQESNRSTARATFPHPHLL